MTQGSQQVSQGLLELLVSVQFSLGGLDHSGIFEGL